MDGYGLLYELKFADYLKREKKVQIWQEGYEGSTLTENLKGSGSPLFASYQSSGDPKYQTIKSSEIEFNIHSLSRFQYLGIADGEDKEFLMKVWEAPVIAGVHELKHVGYVIPEIYSEPYTKSPYKVSIRATSLGLLSNMRYQPGDEYGEFDYDIYSQGNEYQESGEFYLGRVDLMTILKRCLKKLNYGIDIWDSINQYEQRASQTESPLLNIKKDQADFLFEENGRQKALYCSEVLERILKPYVVNFFQDYGAWKIIPMELRANQRRVRIFNSDGALQREVNFNPLNKKVTWIGEDQILEPQPKVDDIEVVYEHGEPEDIVENWNFNKEFTEINRGFDGLIQYPADWELNDPTDWESLILDFSIRGVVVPKENQGPWGVFMNSDLIKDGAYIEQVGTRVIEADGDDSVRFKLTYTGATWKRQLGTDVPDKTKNITHKFQIKVGSKYLKANGKWSDTPVDVELVDIGDGISGYDANPLDFLPKQGASGFREFEILADPIPEAGTPRFRIYKPISEDEGEAGGDTFATTVYSAFSVLYYPDGLPPEETTTFFADQEFDSFAEPINYEIQAGDGPTNFHLSSFLIDTSYGDNLRTELWNRNTLSGELQEIIVNILFLEHQVKSNLIRGTQRVSRLFDRWFVESFEAIGDIGYAPFSGTYDERSCEFNGEYIQVQNAEVDIWGGGDDDEGAELLPGPNFNVQTSLPPPTGDEFSNDTFWAISEIGSSADDMYLNKIVYDKDLEQYTSVESWLLHADLGLPSPFFTYSSNDYFLKLYKNGNIGIYITTTSDYGESQYFVLDSELNLIQSFADIHSGISFDNRALTRGEGLVIDPDGNTYMVVHTNPSGGDGAFFIRKYDENFNLLWNSPTKTFLNSVELGTTSNRVIALVFELGGAFSSSVRVFSFDTLTGEDVNSATLIEETNVSTQGAGVISLKNGNLVLFYEYGSVQNHRMNMTDEDLTSFDEVDIFDTVPELTSPTLWQVIALPDESLIWSNTEEIIKMNPYTKAVDWRNTVVENRWLSLRKDGNLLAGRESSEIFIDITDGSNSGSFLGVVPGRDTNTQLQFYSYYWLDYFKSEILDPGDPNIINAYLTATPQTDDVPFTSLIEFGAENTGEANITLSLVIGGTSKVDLVIPAGSSASGSYPRAFDFPGTYSVQFADQSLNITANGSSASGDYRGKITIEGPADDDTIAVAPSASVYLTNPASQDTECTGSTEFAVQWKASQYCVEITAGTFEGVYFPLISKVNTAIAGLTAVNEGYAPSGYREISFTSDTPGTADNGESIILLVSSNIEGNGLIFNKYTLYLTGGIDAYTVSEEIDILIGGVVFATTAPISALATADTIAQAILDACDAVGSGVYSFAKNGTEITVGSTNGEETLELDIKNAGFAYSVENIEEV